MADKRIMITEHMMHNICELMIELSKCKLTPRAEVLQDEIENQIIKKGEAMKRREEYQQKQSTRYAL